MSRYFLLIIINLPLLLFGIVSAITHYKTGRTTRRRCITEVIFWTLIGITLCCVEPLYNTLIVHNLTNSTPMSLFDMALLTLLLFCLLLIKETNDKIHLLSQKFSRLHENLAISQATLPKKEKS